MGKFDGKIHRLTITALALLFHATAASAAPGDEQITAFKLRLPIYQGNNPVPVLILYSDEAKPVGVNFELKGVRLDWLGKAVSDVRGVVTTPFAVYNRTEHLISGNKWVRYRSKEMDLDGVGFDIDQVKQTIHIRSGVKVALKGKFETTRQKRMRGELPPTDKKVPPARLSLKPEVIPIGKDGAKLKKSQPVAGASAEKDGEDATSTTEFCEKRKNAEFDVVSVVLGGVVIGAMVSWLVFRLRQSGGSKSRK